MAFEFFFNVYPKYRFVKNQNGFSELSFATFFFSIEPYECWAGRLFPDRLTSTRGVANCHGTRAAGKMSRVAGKMSPVVG